MELNELDIEGRWEDVIVYLVVASKFGSKVCRAPMLVKVNVVVATKHSYTNLAKILPFQC